MARGGTCRCGFRASCSLARAAGELDGFDGVDSRSGSVPTGLLSAELPKKFHEPRRWGFSTWRGRIASNLPRAPARVAGVGGVAKASAEGVGGSDSPIDSRSRSDRVRRCLSAAVLRPLSWNARENLFRAAASLRFSKLLSDEHSNANS